MNQTKICTKCNIEKSITEFHKQKHGKYGVQSICKSCKTKYVLDRQQTPKGKAIARAASQKYRQANRDKVLKQYKSYYYANRDKRINQSKVWRQANKDRKAKYQKSYYQTPAGKAAMKAGNQNRRAAKLQNGGKHTGAELLALFDLQSGACPYCNTKLYKSGNNKFHIDHVMPLSKGGSNDISNIQLLCPKCNLSKHDKLPEEFAANFGQLF